jgi:outer membrane receptor protein involved in Fe transport
MQRLGLFVVLMFTLTGSLLAQAPTGTIAGLVTDTTGAVLPAATVTVTNKDTGASRVVHSSLDGSFSIPALPPGNYDVLTEMSGFQPTISPVQVAIGTTATIRLTLQVSTRTEAVTVVGVATTVDLTSNRVQGVVGRQQIESLPLNGRSFLNLAQLQPGVTVVLGNPAQFNAQFNVSVLGGPASRTAITMDGGNIRNPVEGGTGQNFSQEVVQEFQISTANFDLSTGITAFGAINVVTRSGSNDFRGAAYTYYRDHNMGAYPSLSRNNLTDDPDFARRQAGFVLGGPIRKDKVHFFGNFEYTNQKGVYVVQPDLPSVRGFGTLAPAPYIGKQVNGRVDYRVNNKHSMFVRYSHDGNTNSGPFGIPVPPSNFVSNKNYVDQQLVGVTSVLSGSVVNELRFSHMYWKNRNSPAGCEGDLSGNCIGSGGPEIFYLPSVNFALGNNFNSPQGRDLHRYPISNNTTWQKASHQVKFGGEWEYIDAVGYWGFFDPARVYLLSPEFLRGVGVPPALLGIPDQLRTQADLMRLPVAAFLMGIGDRSQPSYNLENARGNNRFHFYAQDGWKVTPDFTFNFGLGWEHETNVLNYDLPKPAYLAPIYGSDLSATKKEYKNFTPAVGFAWNVGKDHPTVIRGGAGIFYDTQLGWWRLGERAVIGGSGRQFIGNAAVTNPANGLPYSTAFLNTLSYNYGTFLTQLPALRAQQEAKYPGTGTQPQILLSKQANALGALYPREFPTARANHFNVGVQRELSGTTVLQADLVYRKLLHGTPGGFFGASVDFNRFNSIEGPVIPRCATTALSNDPNAQCSSGPINFWWAGATSVYKALLVKVDKRFTDKYMFTASYALQDSQSIQDITQNLNDYFATYGPDQPRHNLTLSGMVDLPWKVQLSVLSTFLSRLPVAPTIGGVDNSGTNTSGTGFTPLLAVLGKGYSDFLSKQDLEGLVKDYNATIAGTLTPAGRAGISANQRYPTITLPSDYQLQDIFSSQDLRITKTFRLRDRTDIRIIGEVFNILNTSNLTNFNFNLVSPSTFGKANQRVGQTFGTGGPRAFQLAARVGF